MCASLCSTYTEQDYDIIWENYMYISQDNWWVVYDFGKYNCSKARPRRADVAARLEELWVDRVSKASLLLNTFCQLHFGSVQEPQMYISLDDCGLACNPEKRKCSVMGQRHADLAARLGRGWVQRKGALLVACAFI